MHRADKAQPVRVHRAAVLGGDIAGDLPVRRERVIAERVGRRDADHAEVVFAGEAAAGRRHGADDRDFGMRLGVGQQVKPRPFHRVPIGLLGDDLALEEAQDRVERLGHAVALRHRIDAHHDRIGGKEPRPGAKHDTAPRHVIELHDAVGGHHRMMVGQRDDAGAEPDVAGALGGEGDEDLGRGDDLITRRVVLADPGLVKAELVEMDDEIEVALEAGGRVLLVRMKGRQEDAVPKGYLAHRGLANRALRDAIGFRRAPKPLPHDRVHAPGA